MSVPSRKQMIIQEIFRLLPETYDFRWHRHTEEDLQKLMLVLRERVNPIPGFDLDTYLTKVMHWNDQHRKE